MSTRPPVSRYTYPYTIENGAVERLAFRRRIHGPNGDRLEGDIISEATVARWYYGQMGRAVPHAR